MEKYLCDFVNLSEHLEELNISDNKLLSKSFIKLIYSLATNSRLRYLNLSWNSIIDDKKQDSEASANKKVAQDKKTGFGVNLELDPKFDFVKDKLEVFNTKISDQARVCIENLCQFVQKNKNLIHVDLSNTGLSEKQMWFFGRALRRSKSIRCLHLSGNPGITRRLKDYLCERAHCIRQEPRNTIDMFHLPSNKLLSPKGNDDLEEKHLEALQIKILNNQKKAEQPMELTDSNSPEQLIFSRYHGHKDDIPGSGQWKMIDNN